MLREREVDRLEDQISSLSAGCGKNLDEKIWREIFNLPRSEFLWQSTYVTMDNIGDVESIIQIDHDSSGMGIKLTDIASAASVQRMVSYRLYLESDTDLVLNLLRFLFENALSAIDSNFINGKLYSYPSSS